MFLHCIEKITLCIQNNIMNIYTYCRLLRCFWVWVHAHIIGHWLWQTCCTTIFCWKFSISLNALHIIWILQDTRFYLHVVDQGHIGMNAKALSPLHSDFFVMLRSCALALMSWGSVLSSYFTCFCTLSVSTNTIFAIELFSVDPNKDLYKCSLSLTRSYHG